MKSVGICNALLRVLLSVALVVSFTPIPGHAAEGASAQGGSPSASVGEQAASLSEGSGEAASAADAAAGASVAAVDAADDPAERAADDEPAQQGVLYPFGKLMASGYVYACDKEGDLTKPVDEDDPERNAISARRHEPYRRLPRCRYPRGPV